MITKPSKDEYNSFYQGYIDCVVDDDIEQLLESQLEDFMVFLKNIPEEKHQFAYEEDKWTLTQVLRHIIDTERVFSYRIMCIARNDKVDFPGFDQNDYLEFSNDHDNDFEELLIEFEILRKSNIVMIRNFPNEAFARIGSASGAPVSVRALIYILCGHVAHHVNVIKERYL